MSLFNILVGFFLILSSSLYSQYQIVLIDEATKLPVSNAKVKVNELLTYSSNARGVVLIPSLLLSDNLLIQSAFYQEKILSWSPQVDTILLVPKSKSIKETFIVAQRPQIKVESGKTSLETTNATIQQGSLKELLQQMPGVLLDNNNNVSIKGKTGLRVLVDGKTSQLALSDMKSFIESIPASSIKSIEILTNPGAQYDAQGKAGIINIKLKKDKKDGMNTKISAGIGSVLNKYNSGIFSNYKNNWFNIFANYQFNYNDQWFGYSENRISSLNNTKQYYDYVASWESIHRTHNIKTGLDFFINSTNTISYTFDFNSNIVSGNNYHPNTSQVLDENAVLQTQFISYNKSQNNTQSMSHGLSYRKTFDSSLAEWTADVSYTHFKDYNTNINENLAYNAQKELQPSQYYYFEPVLDNQVHNIMAKTDVSVPSKVAKFDFGLKNEANFNKNDYLAYLKDYLGEKYTTADYINKFNYNENVFASYFNASKTLKKTALDVGVRAENTRINSNNSAVNRNYLNLFPNIGISFPVDSHSNFSARVSRRINRPNFNQLNNRKIYYNRYTANVGVPTLQPEISNIATAQIDRSFLNSSLSISLGAELNIQQNNISEFNFIDSTYTAYFTSGNIGSAQLFNTYLNMYYKPSASFDINLTPQYLYSNYSTDYKGVLSHSRGSGFQLSGQMNVYLPSQIKLSFNGFMTTNMVWAQGNSDFLGTVNGSIGKTFLKGKLAVDLSCQDLFNTNIWRGHQTTGNISSTGIWKPETRIAWLNVSYSFGKKINYKHKDLEKNERLKSSGR